MASSHQPCRLFVVGCSRSGTTVLQRLLVEYLGLITLPETRFFGIAGGGPFLARWPLYLGFANKRAHRALRRLNETLEPLAVPVSHSPALRFSAVVQRFTSALDTLAAKHNAVGWVEKTPKHFRYIKLIERYIPDAHFVHIVRAGPDVVASIVDRARKHAGQFEGHEDPRYAVGLWNEALATASENLGKPGHTVILYEQLCSDPTQTLGRIADALQLRLRAPGEASFSVQESLLRPHETWKADVLQPIVQRASKFDHLFDPATRAWILEALDLQRYESLQQRLNDAQAVGSAGNEM